MAGKVKLTEAQRRAVIVQFFRSPHGVTRLHAMTVVEDYAGHDGAIHRSRKEYDVDWSRRYGYLFHNSGFGGSETVEVRGHYFVNGPARVKPKPPQWVDQRDKPPWRSQRTRALRKVNATRQMMRPPRHVDLQPGQDILDWLQQNGIEQEAVHCSECRDYVPGEGLCSHCWWCDKTGWYSTPSERCGCKDREECHA